MFLCVLCSFVCLCRLFLMHGCAVSRRFIHVCNSDVFGVVYNMYLDHLKFCVVCINGRSDVCCCKCNVRMVMNSPPNLCNLYVRTLVKLYIYIYIYMFYFIH